MAHLGNTVVNGALRVLGQTKIDTLQASGQIKTSFKDSVAMGSYVAAASTIPNLCTELRYSSGAAGSCSIGTAYTKDGVTISTGWYNFLWIPHRSGGVNGSASGDNCDYGSLYLSGMTVSGCYMIRFASGSIAELKNLYVDTNTHRPIQMNGTEILGNNTTALNLKAGSNVSLTNSSGTVTIAATDTTYTAATAAPGNIAASGSAGTSTNYARQDHTHGISLATGDSNGQVKIAGTNVSVKGLGNAAYATIGNTVMEVGKGASRSTSTQGTWTAMCNSSQTGSPTLPTANKWYNVISLNNWTNSSTNWVSQLAICTQDDKTGVWWRTNDSGGTDISSSTWYNLIDTRSFESVLSSKITMGNGDSVSSDGSLLFMKSDYGSQSTNIQFSPYQGFIYADYNSSTHFWSIHSGNSYTTGAVRNANSVNTNGFYYYTSNGPAHGFQSTDGAIYAQFHSDPWGAEIAQDYRDGDLCVRGKNNGTWTAWRPIPAGLTYSDGEINTGHSRNCNDWSNSSGIFYFLSGGPDALSGFKAPDASGTAFCHHYASNSWANMWAQDFYNDGAMYVRSNPGGTWGAWQRLIDSSQIGTARIDRHENDISYLQIKLNYGDDCLNTGMFTFKVTLYDAYVMRIYQISGYCYGGNHWYSPRAVKLAQAGTYSNVTHNYTNDTIYFRYDSNHNLYVYIRQEAYAGALISDVCNGYNHITNLNKIFSLSYVSSYDSTTAQGNVDLVGTGSYDLQDFSSLVGKSRTPTTAGTITLHTYGKIKQLTIWGTTWAATSGAAQLVLMITISSNLCPTTNVEIMGHDDNGAAVFGYITTTGGVYIANHNAVPVYITATYI